MGVKQLWVLSNLSFLIGGAVTLHLCDGIMSPYILYVRLARTVYLHRMYGDFPA